MIAKLKHLLAYGYWRYLFGNKVIIRWRGKLERGLHYAVFGIEVSNNGPHNYLLWCHVGPVGVGFRRTRQPCKTTNRRRECNDNP